MEIRRFLARSKVCHDDLIAVCCQRECFDGSHIGARMSNGKPLAVKDHFEKSINGVRFCGPSDTKRFILSVKVSIEDQLAICFRLNPYVVTMVNAAPITIHSEGSL